VGASAWAQTGQVMPPPVFYASDANGDPCAGCKLFSYLAGTTTKQSTYTTSALSVANANPVVLDSAGRATVFLDSTKSYKFVLAPASDTDPPAAAIYTVDNVVGPFSGVVSITAANTRGLQISRTSADAGLSIQSSGGSGKTYGIVSNTSGGLLIRDDADGTPSMQWLGDNITATLTGTFTVSGGLFAADGFGTHTFSAGGTGTQRLQVRNTTSGTGNQASLDIGNNSTATLGRFVALSSAFTPSGYSLASGVVLEGNGAGGLSLAASDAAGDVRLYAGGSGTARLTVDDTGLTTVTNLQATIQKSGTAQPGFLAYNSAADTVATGATVDFDTEVYDTANNFASDLFTAPQTGIYELCASVTYSDNASSQFTVSINPTGVLYQIYHALAETAGGGGGCVFVSMSTGDSAGVIVNTTDPAATIEGVSGSYRQTWFSGRLVP
jgi:hypothetical protein